MRCIETDPSESDSVQYRLHYRQAAGSGWLTLSAGESGWVPPTAGRPPPGLRIQESQTATVCCYTWPRQHQTAGSRPSVENILLQTGQDAVLVSPGRHRGDVPAEGPADGEPHPGAQPHPGGRAVSQESSHHKHHNITTQSQPSSSYQYRKRIGEKKYKTTFEYKQL